MANAALTRRIEQTIARTRRRKKISKLRRRIARLLLRLQHIAQTLKDILRAMRSSLHTLRRFHAPRTKLLTCARRPCHHQIKTVAEVLHHPIIDRLMILREHPPHLLRIRQQEIEMSATRIEQSAATHRTGSQDLIGNIFQQNLQIERAPSQALQSPLRRNRIDERLDARNICRHEQVHLLLAHRASALARRMLLVVRDAMRLEILQHRCGIRRRQAHMVVEGNIRCLGTRRARWHIAQDRFQHAQKLIELHIAWRAAQEIRLQMLIKLLILGDRRPHVCLLTRELHPPRLSETAQIKRAPSSL